MESDENLAYHVDQNATAHHNNDVPPPMYQLPPHDLPPPPVYQSPQNNVTPPPMYQLPPRGHYPVQPPLPPGHPHFVLTASAPKRWGEVPCEFTCPHCGKTGVTEIKRVNGALVWVVMAVMAFIGCWLFCCLVPLCIPSLKDVEHTCPHCNRLVGHYERIK